MELFDLNTLHSVVSYIHNHPHIGGLITFGIAFVESLALIGGIIPGSVTMTAIGALIGSGSMPFLATILWAVAGAFVGDFLSYWIGFHYNERLIKMWPFRKHPHWLTKGQDFFRAHGGKSVLIGRFFGPVRSAVPLVAGLMQMKVLRFSFAAFMAATLWALVYIFPGIIVGALSLELPPATATKFILIVLALVAFGWLIFIVIHLFFKTMVSMIDKAMGRCWQQLFNHRPTHWLTTLLSDPQRPNPHPHRQLTLALFALFCAGVSIWLFYSVITHGVALELNQPVFELLRSLRTQVGDDILLAVTLLGDVHVQLTAGALIFVWLMFKRYIWAGIHWLGIVLLSAGTTTLIKHFYYFPRPTGLLHQQLDSSFPSGHTILSVALFGFLAMLIAQNSSSGRRKFPYLITGFLMLAIAFSRIYLGGHWLTDVLGSLFLGFTCVALINLSYLRRASQPIPVGKLSAVTGSIFLVVWLGYGITHLRAQADDYTLYWPTVKMEEATWWKVPHPEIPLFILSRLGKPMDVLNVQWLGSLDDIKQALINEGWKEQVIHLDWKGSLNRLSSKANPEHLPVLPWLYQNQAPVLLMTRPDANRGNFPLYFVLWKSNVTFVNDPRTLWIGSVHYFIPRPEKAAMSLSPQSSQMLYENALWVFKLALKHVHSQVWTISLNRQPPIMWPLNWDGKLLLVKPRD